MKRFKLNKQAGLACLLISAHEVEMVSSDLLPRKSDVVPVLPLSLPRVKPKSVDCLPCWERLNRLGWKAGLSFASHGVRIGLRVNDSSLLEQIRTLLPPGSKPTSSPVEDLYSVFAGSSRTGFRIRSYHLLYRQSELLARSLELDSVLDTLRSSLEFNVAMRAQNRLFVHAGVVGWRGYAIVIPGCSRSGKTTLVHALVRAGATYYSDEYAVFDARGRVHPYPRALALREEGGRRRRCPVEELGGCRGSRPLPPGLIAVSQYREGTRWRPRILSPGEAVLALLSHTLLARTRSEAALGILRNAVADTVALRGKRGEAAETAQALLHHFN